MRKYNIKRSQLVKQDASSPLQLEGVVAVEVELLLLLAVVAVQLRVLARQLPDGRTQTAVEVEPTQTHAQDPTRLLETAAELAGPQQHHDETAAGNGVERGQAGTGSGSHARLNAGKTRPSEQLVGVLPHHLAPHAFVLRPAAERPATHYLPKKLALQATANQCGHIFRRRSVLRVRQSMRIAEG